jgi:uncharacterized RDD family membrane protein YckC
MATDQVRQPAVDAASEVIGRRVAAALLDFVPLAILFVVMGLLFGDSKSSGGEASINLHGGAALAFFVLVLVYYFACEAATGQTLGKRALGLRVVGPDGGRAEAGRVATRTALRIIDILPALYLVGFVSVLATGERRRLGDLAAKTSVVAG